CRPPRKRTRRPARLRGGGEFPEIGSGDWMVGGRSAGPLSSAIPAKAGISLTAWLRPKKESFAGMTDLGKCLLLTAKHLHGHCGKRFIPPLRPPRRGRS